MSVFLLSTIKHLDTLKTLVVADTVIYFFDFVQNLFSNYLSSKNTLSLSIANKIKSILII